MGDESELEFLRQKLIRTGRDRQETAIQVESTSSTSSVLTSVTSVTTTTPSPNSPTKAATLLNFVVDQGPGAVGVGVASLMYAAMSSLPYWLPAFAAVKNDGENDMIMTTDFKLYNVE